MTRQHLRITRVRSRRQRGTALAVAMLIIIMLSSIGMIALNSASNDLQTSGALSQAHSAETVAGAGMALGTCEMCRSIDGIILAMQGMRSSRGLAPQYVYNQAALEANVDTSTFQPSSAAGRDSFGLAQDPDPLHAPQPPVIRVQIDRPRESEPIEGFSLREAAGSDSASFCYRSYRVTSDGTYVPIEGPIGQTKARQRAYITVGPVDCTM